MELIVSANNNEEVLVFPYVPPGIVLSDPYTNDTFESVKGQITLLGDKGMRSLEIEGYWPVVSHFPFAHRKSQRNGNEYVEFFKRWNLKRVPFRVILVNNRKELINMAATAQLTWSYDKVGDIRYNLTFQEFLFV